HVLFAVQPAEPGEGELLGGILRLVLALEDGRQAPIELRQLLGVAQPRFYPGAEFLRVAGAQVVRATELLDGLLESAPLPQGPAEVTVDLGNVLLDFQGLAEMSDGLIQLALCRQGHAEVVVGLGEVLPEADGLAILGDSLYWPAPGHESEAKVAVGLGEV